MMTYDSLTNAELTKFFKAGNYKKQIIKNIEIIGQRKLVILGDGRGVNGEILKKVLGQLRKKGVRVPELAFEATNDERTLVKGDNSIRSITELKGMSKAYYVLVSSSYDELEVYLKGMTGRVGSAQSIEKRLQQYGFTERDYCLVNQPVSFLGTYMKMKRSQFNISDKSTQNKLEKDVRRTEPQLAECKDKFHGQRCFIIGYKEGVKLDELNLLFNEKCISYNGICKFFSKTPLRPTQYILSNAEHYLGNGKYIEAMDCFVASNVTVFEDKFEKKPTYFNIMGNGFIPQLPSFGSTQHSEALRRVDDLYIALQLALYEGFSEIYIYGFDGIYDAQITSYDEALVNDEKKYDYPEEAQTLLKNVKTYASSAGVSIYNMSGIDSLNMFESRTIDQIDFSTTKLLSKI